MASWGGIAAQVPGAVRPSDDPNCWLVGLDAVIAETEQMLSGTSAITKWRAEIFRNLERVFQL